MKVRMYLLSRCCKGMFPQLFVGKKCQGKVYCSRGTVGAVVGVMGILPGTNLMFMDDVVCMA